MSLGKKVDALFADVAEALGRMGEEPAEPEPPSTAEQELIVLRAEAETLRRINGEYFALIEMMEKQREEWKTMFFTASAEHGTAQRMLNTIIAECSGLLRNSLRQLNHFRSAAGLEPVVNPKVQGKTLEELPTALPEDYAQRMRDLVSSAMKQTDGKAERERVIERISAKDA